MGLTARKPAAIVAGGLTDISDLVDIDKSILKQISENLRLLGGRVPKPDQQIDAHATILTPKFLFGANSQFWLQTSIDITKY